MVNRSKVNEPANLFTELYSSSYAFRESVWPYFIDERMESRSQEPNRFGLELVAFSRASDDMLVLKDGRAGIWHAWCNNYSPFEDEGDLAEVICAVQKDSSIDQFGLGDDDKDFGEPRPDPTVYFTEMWTSLSKVWDSDPVLTSIELTTDSLMNSVPIEKRFLVASALGSSPLRNEFIARLCLSSRVTFEEGSEMVFFPILEKEIENLNKMEDLISDGS